MGSAYPPAKGDTRLRRAMLSDVLDVVLRHVVGDEDGDSLRLPRRVGRRCVGGDEGVVLQAVVRAHLGGADRRIGLTRVKSWSLKECSAERCSTHSGTSGHRTGGSKATPATDQ